MPKLHFFLKLTLPRYTFFDDMADAEDALMQAHLSYILELFASGHVLLDGPVLAPDGPFIVTVLAVDDEAAARTIAGNCPTVRAGLFTFEIHPMRIVAAQGRRQESALENAANET